MLIRITSAKCIGITSVPIIVETNISNGIGVHLVGLADAAVKESLLRTTTAIQSMEMKVPGKKIVVNLAPADTHKKGSGYDLPIALGILAASQQQEMPELEKYVVVGELGLDGTVRQVPGALLMVEMASKMGLKGCILPFQSALEAVEFKGCKVYGVHNLLDALKIVSGIPEAEELLVSGRHFDLPEARDGNLSGTYANMDFCEIVGQETAKRGLEIAAAGGHNVIMVGSPGSGKSSLAKAMCSILPPMTQDEAVQTSKIYSVAGMGSLTCGLIRTRPFRAPHCSTSIPAMIGGGSDNVMPGEVSLSHNGILFLDEFCEIPRHTIEVLRGPLEDRRVVISRLKNKVEFPADFTLVAASNPCPCGYYGDGDRCSCSVSARKNYLAKLSGPLMDRIDIQIFCKRVSTHELLYKRKMESSAQVAARVAKARKIQKERFRDDGIFCNSQMNNRMLEKYCRLDLESQLFLEKAMERMNLSARACTRIVKLARTIADLEGCRDISISHLAEAVSYRMLDKI